MDFLTMDGSTALIYAAGDGFADCVRVLIKAGADVNKRNKRNTTPLFAACKGQNHNCALMLLSAGAEVSTTGLVEGLTPLHYAANHCNTEFIEVLLSAGAITNLVDRKDRVPLDIAAFGRNAEVVQLLL